MSAKTAPINPEMLKWAREQAGFTRHELAERAKLSASVNSESVDALIAEWEAGQKQPRLSQLEEIAKTIRRPLITFFLANPPHPDNALVDFRTHVGESPGHNSPEFSALQRRLLVLQKQLKYIMRDEEHPLDFIGSMRTNLQVQSIVDKIRDVLKITYDYQRTVHNPDKFQSQLRSKMEEVGVFVLFEGDLGSHHTKIAPREFRGIAMSDRYAPMIVVNRNDTQNARSFTLLHEFSHLLIGESGVSSGNYADVQRLESATEKLCNQVAAEFLVPQDMLKQACAGSVITIETVDALAKRFLASSVVVAIQLFVANIIPVSTMRKLNFELDTRWAEQKAMRKHSQSKKMSRNKMDRYRLGKRTLGIVLDAAFSNKITLHKASTLLGISTDRFTKVR